MDVPRVQDLSIEDLDLRDTFLETKFPGPGEVFHTFERSDPTGRLRKITVEETWYIKKSLGKGDFGSVWLQERSNPDASGKPSLRAVKEMAKSRLPNGKYKRELQAMAKFSLERYQHCFVTSYGWYEDDTTVYIAMEYFPHRDLEFHLHTPFNEEEVALIASQLVDGIKFLQENKSVYRDLKPACRALTKTNGGSKLATLASASGPWEYRRDGYFPPAAALWKMGATKDCHAFINMTMASYPANRISARDAENHPCIRGVKQPKIGKTRPSSTGKANSYLSGNWPASPQMLLYPPISQIPLRIRLWTLQDLSREYQMLYGLDTSSEIGIDKSGREDWAQRVQKIVISPKETAASSTITAAKDMISRLWNLQIGSSNTHKMDPDETNFTDDDYQISQVSGWLRTGETKPDNHLTILPNREIGSANGLIEVHENTNETGHAEEEVDEDLAFTSNSLDISEDERETKVKMGLDFLQAYLNAPTAGSLESWLSHHGYQGL